MQDYIWNNEIFDADTSKSVENILTVSSDDKKLEYMIRELLINRRENSIIFTNDTSAYKDACDKLKENGYVITYISSNSVFPSDDFFSVFTKPKQIVFIDTAYPCWVFFEEIFVLRQIFMNEESPYLRIILDKESAGSIYNIKQYFKCARLKNIGIYIYTNTMLFKKQVYNEIAVNCKGIIYTDIYDNLIMDWIRNTFCAPLANTFTKNEITCLYKDNVSVYKQDLTKQTATS